MILLAPHPDDEVLFASYIIQRLHPFVVICTDGTTHEKFGVTWQQRRQESIAASKVLNYDIYFLGIPEEQLTYDVLKKELLKFNSGTWWCPAKQGGHKHHDLVYDVVKELQNNFMSYSTYSKDSLMPSGQYKMEPNNAEKILKDSALQCFTSQIKINKHHFDAVTDQPEYYNIETYEEDDNCPVVW